MAINFTPFKEVIKNYLDNYASNDSVFAEKYNNPDKSLDKCCDYIYQEVRKQLGAGERQIACLDDEVFGLAVHYYDEDDIKVEGPAVKVEAIAVQEEKPAKKRGRKAKSKEDEAPVEVEVPAETDDEMEIEAVMDEEADDDMPEPLDIPLF